MVDDGVQVSEEGEEVGDKVGDMWASSGILDLLQLRYGDDDGDYLVGGYVVAHLKRDSVQPGEK